jgi:adenylate cyclase
MLSFSTRRSGGGQLVEAKKPRGREWRRIAIGIAISLGAVTCTLGLSHFRFFQLVHLKALDSLFLIRGRREPANIVLVTIDEKSLSTFAELSIFWHPYYAEAIEAAAGAGAKVVGLDVAFGVPVEKWEPGHDARLAAAVSSTYATMPTVCGFVAASMGRQEQWPVPVNMIASALGLSAMANLTVDADDFIRRQELIEAPDPASKIPPMRSFALRLAEFYLGKEARFENGDLYFGDQLIPIDEQRRIMINYAGPPDTFPRISLSDFIAAARAADEAKLREWVEGKAVLIGPDSISDRHATPFYTMFSGSRWNTAGVEIHANALHTLLTGNYLIPVPNWLRIIVLFAVAGMTMIIVFGQRPRVAALWLAGNAAVTVWLNYMLFRDGMLLATTEMFAAGTLALLASLLYRFLSAEKRGLVFRRAVSMFVGKQMASELDVSEQIALTSVRKQVTIMFTDVRGFTSYCDTKDPGEVVEMLNVYLEQMVAIIVSHGGQANKFMGDGILIIFSDDDDGARPGDHATRALHCAYEMVTAPGQFKTGAGIHSGEAIVGNVGSAEKMEYTVLGDTVNLASRLESENKKQRTKLLLSGSTKRALLDETELTPLGSIPIRGKTEPVQIYTLAELAPEPQPAVTASKES